MTHFRQAFLAELVKVGAPRSILTPGSSNVKGWRYVGAKKQLFVTFKNGATYRYDEVPVMVARALRRNKSAGRTVNRMVKAQGYTYEKVAVPVIDPLLSGMGSMGREIDRQIEKHETPINVALGAALGGGLGVPVGAMAGGALQSYRIGKKLQHPKASAGALRRMLHAGRRLPKGEELARQIRKAINRGVLIGGGGGLAAGGLMGYQIAKALKRAREAKEGQEKRANGDMIAYFRDHPDKYEAWKNRQLAEARRKRSRGNPRWGKRLTARERFVISRSGSTKKASAIDCLEDRITRKRRLIAKLAGAAKKQVTWNGLKMKLEYLTGDKRSGVNGQTGEKWERTMRDNYGYIPGTMGQGADGEAIDIYLADEPVEGQIYRIKQKKRDGSYDEDKYMVGYESADQARAAFLRNMPEWAFGSMSGMSTDSFRQLVGQEAA